MFDEKQGALVLRSLGEQDGKRAPYIIPLVELQDTDLRVHLKLSYITPQEGLGTFTSSSSSF